MSLKIFKHSENIHFFIRASFSKVPLGYFSNSRLCFPRKSGLKLKHTRKASTLPFYYALLIKNNKNGFKRIKSGLFWYRTNQLSYPKDSKIRQEGFRLEQSCSILS